MPTKKETKNYNLGRIIKDYIVEAEASPFDDTPLLKKQRENIYKRLIMSYGIDAHDIFTDYLLRLSNNRETSKRLTTSTSKLIILADNLIKNDN